MSELQIDEAILSVIKARWMKVAMVIAKVSELVGSDLPEGEAGLNLIESRIEVLVLQNCLTAQGNIKNWRHSEVRMPDDSVPPTQ